MPNFEEKKLTDIDRRAMDLEDKLPISERTQENNLLARLMALYLENEKYENLTIRERLKRCRLNPYQALEGKVALNADLEMIGQEMRVQPALVPIMWAAWLKNYDQHGREATGSYTWLTLSEGTRDKRSALVKRAVEAARNIEEALTVSTVAEPLVSLMIAREECDALLIQIGGLEKSIQSDLNISVSGRKPSRRGLVSDKDLLAFFQRHALGLKADDKAVWDCFLEPDERENSKDPNIQGMARKRASSAVSKVQTELNRILAKRTKAIAQ